LLAAPASAASLYGTVVDISDGDTITIISLNKPVKIRLLAVVAPLEAQTFSDVARQHLSELVLRKVVLVEYSGLVENNFILGKVSCKDVDIGAQMLRDGVAWFDRAASSRLTDSDRQVYEQCELAARTEHRGLWQESSPVAPWDFKRQQAAQAANASITARSTPSGSGQSGRKALGSEDLLRGLMGTNSSGSASASVPDSGDQEWRTLTPKNEHFSVMVPGVGVETTNTFPIGAEFGTGHYWVGRRDASVYLLSWQKGPNLKYTDAAVFSEFTRGVVIGLNHGFARTGTEAEFTITDERRLNLDGYAGRQYEVSAPGLPAVIRVFTKQVGDQREVYLVGVLNSTEDNPTVGKFFSSLSLDRKR